jgi:hypothetical protein
MRIRIVFSTLTLALLYCLPASAQAPKAAKNANPGVNPVRLMDRQEVRVRFRNTGSTLAMAMEVFVKDGATVAQNAR